MATLPLTDAQLSLLRSAGGGVLLRPARRVLRALTKRGHDAVVIGGAVRDLFLERSPGDLDIATTATPDQVLEIARSEGWLPIPVGKAFGVVRVRLSGAEFEVATYRSEEGYSDGRRPDLDGIRFQGSLEEDVRRRDFTMNGLALRLLDDPPLIIDLVGGVSDLRRRVIRTIGDPLERFDEDALRPLRAIRFSAVLGFAIEERTSAAMRAKAAGLSRVSGERVLQELFKAFGQGDACSATNLLLDTGFLPHLFPDVWNADTPEAAAPVRLRGLMSHLPRTPGLPLFLAALAAAGDEDLAGGEAAEARGAACMDLLKASREDRIAVLEALRGAATLARADALPLPRRADLYRSRHYNRAMALARAVAAVAGQSIEALAVFDQERAALPSVRLDPPTLVTGKDLKDLGLPQGPRFKKLLDAVRDRQVEGEIETREEALAWLSETTSFRGSQRR